jgi:hypothetical protein
MSKEQLKAEYVMSGEFALENGAPILIDHQVGILCVPPLCSRVLLVQTFEAVEQKEIS